MNKLIQFEAHHIERIKALNVLDIQLYDQAKREFLIRLEAAELNNRQLHRLRSKNRRQHLSVSHYHKKLKNFVVQLYQKLRK